MIVIGIPTVGVMSAEFFSAYEALRKPTLPDGSPDWVTITVRRQVIQRARNTIVAHAVRQEPAPPYLRGIPTPYPEATHVFFLDDDVLVPPDGLLRLLAHDVPIVSGFYVERAAPHFPVAYRHGADLHVPLTRFCSGLQRVDAVGAGCLLVKTEVFRALEPEWFAFAPGYSEDSYFCAQARRAGFEVLLDFDV
jgi:hypothetical protein